MRLLFLLVVLAALAAPARAAPIPNVAIFLADDVGYGDLRLNGGPIATPNLERIAREGTHFRQFHVTAVCSSTRAALLTGVYQQRMTTSGALDTALLYDSNEGIPSWTVTIPEMLSATHAGRVMLGKWHLGGNLGRQPQFHPMRHGITYFEGILGPQADMNFPPWYRNLSRVTGFHNYVTTYTADRAIAQINDNTNSVGRGSSTCRFRQHTRRSPCPAIRRGRTTAPSVRRSSVFSIRASAALWTEYGLLNAQHWFSTPTTTDRH